MLETHAGAAATRPPCAVRPREGERADRRARWLAAGILPGAFLLAAAILGALFWGLLLPAWGWMWTLAAAILFGFKWLTFVRALEDGVRPSAARTLAYLFFWVGMDAASFLRSARRKDGAQGKRPGKREWVRGFLAMAAGAALIWGAVPRLRESSEFLAGWAGLEGLLLLLHFGAFHLLAQAYLLAGVEARPLMRAPLASRSVSDLWARRWNTAFHHLALVLVFEPLHPRLGRAGATLAAFALSGLVHDLVISLPAGGGFGLPTAYFLLQALGVLLERSAPGKRWGLDRPPLGRAFVALLALVPAVALFHPPFVERVALPFLEAIGAG